MHIFRRLSLFIFFCFFLVYIGFGVFCVFRKKVLVFCFYLYVIFVKFAKLARFLGKFLKLIGSQLFLVYEIFSFWRLIFFKILVPSFYWLTFSPML